MSDSVRPHRRQPTRLPRPWDSPGKNPGAGCHFLLQCMKVKSESEVAQSCPTPSDPMDCSLPGSSVPGIFPGKSTGVGCHFLLQGIFLTQGLSPGLLHCMQMLYSLTYQFSGSVMSNSLRPHRLQHARLPCPSPTPRAYSNSCPLSRQCHPTISSSVIPFSSCLQSFPASESFQMSQFFSSGGQSIGVSASASVLPMNIQG